MITICMNDRQHVITDCMSSYLYVRKSEYVGYLIFKVTFLFFSSLKNYSYCIFLVLKSITYTMSKILCTVL